MNPAPDSDIPLVTAVSLTCCPYLRLKDDPDSWALFANAEHRCYAPLGSRPRTSTVEPRHQEQLCQSQRFSECRRFQQTAPVWNTAGKPSRARLALAVGVVFLAAAALATNLIYSGGGTLADGQPPALPANIVPTQGSGGRLVVDPSPTSSLTEQPGDRTSCEEIRETAYRSDAERVWYLRNCLTPTPLITTPIAAAGSIFHRVAPGDTLEALALTYGASVEAIMRANNLQSSLILAGEILAIPLVPTATVTPTPSPVR
jgi:LysM repeat protein